MKIKLLLFTSIISMVFLAACGGKSDADLSTAAGEALKGDTATAGVTVEVKDGVATIKGEVADDAAKAKAEQLVKAVEGMKSVVNEVSVTPPPPAASSSDPELKAAVEEGLKKKNITGISVEAKDGVVTLRGSVTKDKLAEVMIVANEAKPLRVDNQLDVK